MGREKLFRLGYESALIIFSVLLALLIDEYRVKLNEEALTQKALSNVRSELQNNLQTMEYWYEYHSDVAKNMKAALASEEFDEADYIIDGEVNIFSLIPKGVYQGLIDDSAWEAYRSSEVFSRLNFETMLALSRVYNLQNSGVQQSLRMIIEIFSSRDFIQQDKVKENLVMLKRAFAELSAQESYLIHNYKETLAALPEEE
ncbi:MAG: hypothetical protein GJ680_02810 [Alteromonadaceae bacterium]|nr:hypothetical protein [Alteromonadaceae bacterium]